MPTMASRRVVKSREQEKSRWYTEARASSRRSSLQQMLALENGCSSGCDASRNQRAVERDVIWVSPPSSHQKAAIVSEDNTALVNPKLEPRGYTNIPFSSRRSTIRVWSRQNLLIRARTNHKTKPTRRKSASPATMTATARSKPKGERVSVGEMEGSNIPKESVSRRRGEGEGAERRIIYEVAEARQKVPAPAKQKKGRSSFGIGAHLRP
jgi:hypothetical protein